MADAELVGLHAGRKPRTGSVLGRHGSPTRSSKVEGSTPSQSSDQKEPAEAKIVSMLDDTREDIGTCGDDTSSSSAQVKTSETAGTAGLTEKKYTPPGRSESGTSQKVSEDKT